MQKNGAGLHTASSAWWDNTTDGETAQYRASQAPGPASECATAQGAAPSGVTTRRCIASHPCLACRCRWQTRALHPFIVAGRCCCVQSFSSRVPSVRRDAGMVEETPTTSRDARSFVSSSAEQCYLIASVLVVVVFVSSVVLLLTIADGGVRLEVVVVRGILPTTTTRTRPPPRSSSYRRAATTERRTSSITPPTLPRYLDRRGGGIVVIAYRDSRPSTIISYLNRVY